MTQSDTNNTMLPVVVEAPIPKPGFARPGSNAEFISQLIAARDHLASQRARRRAAVDTALDAYDEGSARGIRRLPSGSYRSRTV